jgi:uncharacterized membrane protein
MPWIDLLRWLHVVGATLLFGTGLGIAFFMALAHRTRDPAVVAHVAGTVVIADGLFTATAAVAQPITGYALARLVGWPLTEDWVLVSLILYAVTGAFWLPVLWVQRRMRDLARAAAAAGEPLPPAYHRLFRIWFACGWPAFLSVLAILWLMTAKPSIRLF